MGSKNTKKERGLVIVGGDDEERRRAVTRNDVGTSRESGDKLPRNRKDRRSPLLSSLWAASLSRICLLLQRL